MGNLDLPADITSAPLPATTPQGVLCLLPQQRGRFFEVLEFGR